MSATCLGLTVELRLADRTLAYSTNGVTASPFPLTAGHPFLVEEEPLDGPGDYAIDNVFIRPPLIFDRVVNAQARYQTAGLEIGTRSRLDSGQLWVCTAPRSDRQNFVRVALRTFVGGGTDQELNAFEVKEIWVQPETPRGQRVHDSEVCVMDAPLHYAIRPKALRVVVPALKTRSES
jgi:hypothetical protein